MEALALTILILLSLIGFCAIFFTTFGTLIIFIGAVAHSLLTGFAFINPKVLLILLLLYLCGEVVEYLFVIIGAKKFGASNAATVGAVVGGIIGAVAGVLFPGAGIVLGTFLGIFLGAFLVELIIHKDLIKSLKAGTGGVVGRVGAVAVKVVIALIMFVVIFSHIAGIGLVSH